MSLLILTLWCVNQPSSGWSFTQKITFPELANIYFYLLVNVGQDNSLQVFPKVDIRTQFTHFLASMARSLSNTYKCRSTDLLLHRLLSFSDFTRLSNLTIFQPKVSYSLQINQGNYASKWASFLLKLFHGHTWSCIKMCLK